MSFKSMIKKIFPDKPKFIATENNLYTLEESGYLAHEIRSIAKQNMLVHTKHLVCFMDVMNYESSIVADKNTFGDTKKLLSEVSTLLNNLSNHGRKFNLIDENGKISQIQIGAKICVSLLFNCLVISYDFSEQREDLIDIYFALREISIVAVELVRNGYFVQGGLAFGDLYHEEQKCIGIAIEKAILCSRHAIYPRIVFDKDFFLEKAEGSILPNVCDISKNYKQLEDIFHCVDLKNFQNEICRDARRDPSLIHFLDYLEITLSECPEIISELKEKIVTGIFKTTGEEKERFLWYAEYFNSIVHSTLCYENEACINIEK